VGSVVWGMPLGAVGAIPSAPSAPLVSMAVAHISTVRAYGIVKRLRAVLSLTGRTPIVYSRYRSLAAVFFRPIHEKRALGLSFSQRGTTVSPTSRG
jgi:hypothetical protein